MYSPEVLDHFKSPRNAGELESATASVDVSNPVCGDVLRLAVRVEAGRIGAVRFLARGCVAAIACGSRLTEMMAGRAVAELDGITAEEISTSLGGLPPASSHAAELATDALAELRRQLG